MQVGDLVRHKNSKVVGIITHIYTGFDNLVKVSWADGHITPAGRESECKPKRVLEVISCK